MRRSLPPGPVPSSAIRTGCLGTRLTATSSRWARFSDSLTRSAPEFILAGDRQWRRFLSHDLALSATELVKKFVGRRVVDWDDIAVPKGEGKRGGEGKSVAVRVH